MIIHVTKTALLNFGLNIIIHIDTKINTEYTV